MLNRIPNAIGAQGPGAASQPGPVAALRAAVPPTPLARQEPPAGGALIRLMHKVEPERSNARRQAEPRRCIIFLHVPKTAGWTLRGVLRYKYPSEILFLDDPSDPLGGIEAIPLEDRRRARVATGHVFYGVHEHIPQPTEYITVLREPIARVVSMYNHVLRRPEHRLHDEVAGSGMGLEEFARSCADAGIDNQQTRLISGRGAGRGGAPRLRRARTWVAPRLERGDLEQAKRNLDDFLLVGLTERFDETFILLRRVLGWRLPMYATRNVGRAANGSPPERAVGAGDRADQGAKRARPRALRACAAGCSRRPSRGRAPRSSARWRRSGC